MAHPHYETLAKRLERIREALRRGLVTIDEANTEASLELRYRHHAA